MRQRHGGGRRGAARSLVSAAGGALVRLTSMCAACMAVRGGGARTGQGGQSEDGEGTDPRAAAGAYCHAWTQELLPGMDPRVTARHGPRDALGWPRGWPRGWRSIEHRGARCSMLTARHGPLSRRWPLLHQAWTPEPSRTGQGRPVPASVPDAVPQQSCHTDMPAAVRAVIGALPRCSNS